MREDERHSTISGKVMANSVVNVIEIWFSFHLAMTFEAFIARWAKTRDDCFKDFKHASAEFVVSPRGYLSLFMSEDFGFFYDF